MENPPKSKLRTSFHLKKLQWRGKTVESIPATLRLQGAQKQLLGSWFSECCDPADPTMSTTCRYLRDWSTNSSDAASDACQSSYASCSAAGGLEVLMLPGFWVYGEHRTPVSLPVFNQHCQAQPPKALSQLQGLRVLSLDGYGLMWTVKHVASFVSLLPTLEQLYLGSNYISGALDIQACGMFAGNLATLSFRNDLQSSDYFNTIGGDVHSCVFSEKLEALNLNGNEIRSLPPVPAGSPLRSLRVANQRTQDGSWTFSGGISSSLLAAEQLMVLDLSANNLTGRIPDLPPNLQLLDLSSNDLSGGFPASLWGMSELMLLNLEENPSLGGPLQDTGLGKLEKVSVIMLSNTAMSGDLNSVDWSKLEYLSVLQMSSTQVSGILPPALATRPNLQLLDLSKNRGITSQADFAQTLDPNNKINIYVMNDCGLQDLPDGLANLAVFQSNETYQSSTVEWVGVGKVFDVSGNQISGIAIPDWLIIPFPASPMFASGAAFLGLQGQDPANATNPDNRMSCSGTPLSTEEFMISKSVFPTLAGADASMGASQYGLADNSQQYCLNFNGAPVLIGTTLKIGQRSAPVPSPTGTPTVVKPPATAAMQSTGHVTGSNSTTGLTDSALIAVVVVSVLLLLILAGGGGFVMYRLMHNKKVRPFSKFDDEQPQPQTAPGVELGMGKKWGKEADVAQLQV